MPRDFEREREQHASLDELAILRHAERLSLIGGRERAIKALQAALREVSSTDTLASDLQMTR